MTQQPPDPTPLNSVLPNTRHLGATVIAGLAFLALHLPFVAWAPDDIDATNFVMALNHFDVREHQPHPPGYPVFVAMGRAVRPLVSSIGQVTGPSFPEAVDVNALAMVSATFGALALVPLVLLWTSIGRDPARAALAAVLAAASPLYWYTGIRPLSDLPGLAAALTSIALVVDQIARRAEPSPLRLLTAGAVAGIALGIRTQTLWLTAPALALCLAVTLWRRQARGAAAVGIGVGAGIVVWAIPLIAASGGWRSYMDVITAQAADDFRGAILAVDFSPRRLAFGLYDTFVLPWNSGVSAFIVLGFAFAGAIRMLREQRAALLLVAVLFGPYLVMHLLFQETSHTRYALPLIPPIAFLAVQAFRASTFVICATTVGIVLATVFTSMGPVMAQARNGSPAVRALRDMREALSTTVVSPVIGMHHAVQRQLRFAAFENNVLPSAAPYEWLSIVDHFRSGGETPVWFLAASRRSDLALIDPAAKRLVKEYSWTFNPKAVLGGARPRMVRWYEITRPGWMAGEGWALTPETRGVAVRARRSPAGGATVAYIARRPEAAVVMIGGRNLGGPCQTAARLEATLDGRVIAEWQLSAGEPFVHFVDLPAGGLAGPHGFAELRLRASDLSGAGLGVDVALEQFDVQSGRRPVAALAQGWYEPELEPDTGVRWRWTGRRAVVQLRNFGRDVVLQLDVDDPVRTIGQAMELQVRAGGHVIATRHFDSRVTWDVPIAASVLVRARGRVTVTSSAAFVPNRVSSSADARELSLRVFSLDVRFQGAADTGGS